MVTELLSLDSEEWHLTIVPKWVPKREPTYEDCPQCNGKGGYKNWGLGSYDENDADKLPNGLVRCTQCWGTGKRMVDQGFSTEPPKLPKDFITHMRKAYQEYCRNAKRLENVEAFWIGEE